jgi:iron complex outermembrane receptor protein
MNLRVLTALAITCIGMQVLAQDEHATVSESQTRIRFEDESVQWIPYSVSVLTKSELESTYRRDLEHIESVVPGLIVDRINRTPRGAAIAIRGVGSSEPSKAFDPAVAVNIDGVYVGTHTNRLQVLFDFERIEVVRSPHIFEANPNVGGSINLERSRPTGEFDIDVRASAGIDKRREMDAVLNFPIVDSLNAKIGLFWKDRGGDYIKNVYADRDENTEDYYLFSTMLSWDFRDLFKLTYTFDTEESEETSPALLNISAPTDLLCSTTANDAFPNCRRGVGNPELDSLRRTAQNYSNNAEFEGDHHTLKVEFEAIDHTFTSITGYRDTKDFMDLDMDASNADFYHLSQDQSYEQFSQEITAHRELNEKLSYSAGIYWLDSSSDIFQQEHHILGKIGDAGFSEGHAAGEIQELSSEQESELFSGFAHAKYILNDQWIADLGVRWTEVDRDMKHRPSRIRLGDAVSPLRTVIHSSESSKELLFSGGVSYKVDEEAMIYFRISEGFLPGGFDENAMSAVSGNSYGSETSLTGELGLKSDWWDDRLRINLVFFETEIDNKVERADGYVSPGVIESLLDNVADLDITGWDLEIESTPLENLVLKAAFSHTNSNYTKYLVQDLANPGEFQNLKYLSPERAPGYNLYFGAHYSFPFARGHIRTYAGYRLIDDYQTYPLLPEGEVKNWSSLDLSISYHWEEWVFRLFSNNVKNKEFIQNIQNVTQTAILPVEGRQNVPSLMTFTEYNQPRYTGLEIIYRPDF